MRSFRGFTLMELTVVLAVIVTLALILTPSISTFINDSRTARTRADAQTIVSAIVQFEKDNGFFPQWKVAVAGGPGTAANKLDLLISPGKTPMESPQTLWTTTSPAARTDTLANQLIANAPGYTLKTGSSRFGWNRPYVSSAIGPDAWNNCYIVNIGLADPTVGAAGKDAIWVISAGPNGILETGYRIAVTAATLGGDDIGGRLQ
jgi:prepilin-type N-terminal cleavage/methylation domain-containing protein